MSDTTGIEWTDHTFNPWWGCVRISPACRFCYADRDARRYGFDVWRKHGPRRMLSERNWERPLKWNRDAEQAGVPAKVFCASMADVFEDHPQVVEARKRLWGVIEATPWLCWQLLTKRPENIAGMAPWGSDWPPHVWIGTSVETQKYANERIPLLLQIPAAVRFLSCEPLLGPVDLTRIPAGHPSGTGVPATRSALSSPCARCGGWGTDCGKRGTHFVNRSGTELCVNWVIAGGESGQRARPSHPDNFRALRDQCQAAGVPFLFKQWGEWRPLLNAEYPPPARTTTIRLPGQPTAKIMTRVGKKAAGRKLNGQTWDGYPREAEVIPA